MWLAEAASGSKGHRGIAYPPSGGKPDTPAFWRAVGCSRAMPTRLYKTFRRKHPAVHQRAGTEDGLRATATGTRHRKMLQVQSLPWVINFFFYKMSAPQIIYQADTHLNGPVEVDGSIFLASQKGDIIGWKDDQHKV